MRNSKQQKSDTLDFMSEAAESADASNWNTTMEEHTGGRKYVLTRRGRAEDIYLNILAPDAHPNLLIATFFANHSAKNEKQLLQRGEFRGLLGELLKIAKSDNRSTLCVPAFNESINDLILRSGGKLSESGPFPSGSMDISVDNLQRLHEQLKTRSAGK
jgi:hypothetical protein